MVDTHEVDDPDDESVSLAFGPNVAGWPTARVFRPAGGLTPRTRNTGKDLCNR